MLFLVSLERTPSGIVVRFCNGGNIDIGAVLVPIVFCRVAAKSDPESDIGSGTGYSIGGEGVIFPVGDIPDLGGDAAAAGGSLGIALGGSLGPLPKLATVNDGGLCLSSESSPSVPVAGRRGGDDLDGGAESDSLLGLLSLFIETACVFRTAAYSLPTLSSGGGTIGRPGWYATVFPAVSLWGSPMIVRCVVKQIGNLTN